jgi:glycosyltransferase involved in cell wall biosynthesis
MRSPLISAIVRVYNAERYIGQTLEAILSQTHPPYEVVVVDDGSTDGTPDELARFGEDIRVVRQANSGHAPAFNRAFGAARGDYVANCDADDVWEHDKLERQVEALATHPEIDFAFSAARVFGNRDGRWGMPTDDEPYARIMDRRTFGRTMYRSNPICPSTAVIRRCLYERVGPFVGKEQIAIEDYDYWMRALRAGAVFYYDPAMLVRYRRHDVNVSSNYRAMGEADLAVHRWNADLVDSPSLVREVLARDYFVLGRLLREENRAREARAAFVSSLRQKLTLRGLAWALLLSAPERHRRTLSDRVISVKRAVSHGFVMTARRRLNSQARQ